MAEALFISVLAGLIVIFVVALFRGAWARDRNPIKVHDAPRTIPKSVLIDARAEHTLPPSFIFATAPTSEPPDPYFDTTGYIEWGLANGGVYAGKLFHRFKIRGVGQSPVSLENVVVKVLDRRPPLRGFVLELAAGGDSIERHIYADLDHTDEGGYARAKQIVDVWDPATEDFIAQPWDLLNVSQTDEETFVLAASTERYDCEFVVEIHYRAEHQSGVHVINRGGKPLRVSARAEGSTAQYWEPPDQFADS